MKTTFISLLILFFGNAHSQFKQDTTVLNYIAQYSAIAVEEQIRTGIPASITLAQGIHESGAGRGDLAIRSNNHFGIKCKSNWTGLTAFHDDDEQGECFRAYENVAASYKDHSDFLKTGKRYAFLFDFPVTDYKNWANGLKNAGYATNPKYPILLIKLIENYNLNQFAETALALQNNVSCDEFAIEAKNQAPE
jgi:flagellum-specific peptidoglycan hydrolase FlgJ